MEGQFKYYIEDLKNIIYSENIKEDIITIKLTDYFKSLSTFLDRIFVRFCEKYNIKTLPHAQKKIYFPSSRKWINKFEKIHEDLSNNICFKFIKKIATIIEKNNLKILFNLSHNGILERKNLEYTKFIKTKNRLNIKIENGKPIFKTTVLEESHFANHYIIKYDNISYDINNIFIIFDYLKSIFIEFESV